MKNKLSWFERVLVRVALAKAALIATLHPTAIVLAADTVVACGKRILPKAEDEKIARLCLKLLSGKRHRVYTAVVVALPLTSPPLAGGTEGGK